MNPNPSGGLFLILFLALTIWAVVAGPGKWKLLNFFISLGGAGIGILVGVMIGAFSGNSVLAGHHAASLFPIFGSAAAYICVRRNMIRKKEAVLSAHSDTLTP